MRSLRIFLVFFFMLIITRSAYSQDYSSFDSLAHPRLFLNESDFAQLKDRVTKSESSDSILVALHKLVIKRAGDIGLNSEPIKFQFNGQRLLERSREALERIFLCSYAYRFTGDAKYLRHAISDLDTVCSFNTWNAHVHFLDAAEMALAVAISYDWLYDSLPNYLRTKAFNALNDFAFQPSANPDWSGFYFSEGNWNQVCNAGLVAGAIATYEQADTTAQRIINDAIKTNRRIMRAVYSPDGNYPEGPGYWSYGNIFQVILLSELEYVFGTDFDLSKTSGFSKTAEYKLFTVRPGRKVFNYSDNIDTLFPSYPLWYFAARFSDSSILRTELELLSQGKYESVDEVRLLPLLLSYAMKIDFSKQTSAKNDMFFGRGTTPVVMVKGNSSIDNSEYYLGAKAGTTTTNHSHMDAGSFVYDAFGYNWAIDLNRQDYPVAEKIASSHKGNFWDMSQNSLRWRFLRMNNRFHNTLTINDEDHYVKGKTQLISVIDSLEYKGAVMDLTQLFKSQVEKVTRRIVISGDGSLTITDTIIANDTDDADIRWSMVTPSDVNVLEDRINLSQGSVSLSLVCESDGIPINYKEWSSHPRDYDYVFSKTEDDNPGVSVCGFTASVEKGKTAVFTTVLKKL